MTNLWLGPLENTKVILLDYSALFEAGYSSLFQNLTETIIDRQIQIAICLSFNYYHLCVFRALNKNEKEMLQQIEAFLDNLSQEKLLLPEKSHMSVFSLLTKYAARKDACLFTSSHSSVLNQIRSAGLEAEIPICIIDKEKFVMYPDLSSFLQTAENISVNPVASSTDYLDVAIHVNIGDKVYTKSGDSVLLSEKISTGSEGLVFKTEDPAFVAKIYHRGVMTALRWMKLTRMTKMGLLAKGICWPTDLLYNQNHEPVGYLMPTAQGYTLGTVFDGQDAIMDRFPDWDRSSIVQAACQIFEKIIYLHLHGILIGDIQMKNIMIKSPREVYIIDMDSVQLDDLPCPVGTEEFTPPELWDRSFSTFLRTPQHEDYSCGILAFSILFCGQHPYNQRLGKETLREEISSRSFPYKCGQEENSRAPLGGYDKIWQAIPSEMQTMFYNAFSEGKRYDTVAWYAAMDLYKDQLSSTALTDPQAYSVFPYTKQAAAKNEEAKPLYKRSIRDSIIHVPDSSDKAHAAAERVMYNGRVTGVAFVNQEKLTELELNNYKKKLSDENKTVPGSSAFQKVEKSIPAAANQVHTINQDTRHKNRKRNSVQKSNKSKVLFGAVLAAAVVLAAVVYFFFLS